MEGRAIFTLQCYISSCHIFLLYNSMDSPTAIEMRQLKRTRSSRSTNSECWRNGDCDL